MEPKAKPGKNFNESSAHGKAHHHEMGIDAREIGNDTTSSKFYVPQAGEKRSMIKPKGVEVYLGDHPLNYTTELSSNQVGMPPDFVKAKPLRNRTEL